MPNLDDGSVVRDGFASSYGRFVAMPGRVERVEGTKLIHMFLPHLSAEAHKTLKRFGGDYFVRGQLRHYGVTFDEREIWGNGSALLSKLLLTRSFDKIPEHIVELRAAMHREWLNKQTAKQLSEHPDLVMEKYFLSYGRPDCGRTTSVVGIPFGLDSADGIGKIRDAARTVTGLHYQTGLGPETQTIFLGWDPVAVGEAAEAHATNEAAEMKAAAERRKDQRTKLHTSYLYGLKRKKPPRGSKSYSPVGRYIVDCDKIEGHWPDEAKDLRLNIRKAKATNIFEIHFDFGSLEGMMLMCADRDTLEQHCSWLDRESETGSDSGDDDSDNSDYDEDCGVPLGIWLSRPPRTARRRKARDYVARGTARKKIKIKAAQPRTYFLRLRCRDTVEGTHFTTEKGSIKFKDVTLTGFIGKATFPYVGRAIPFSGRKISDSPPNAGFWEWTDY